MTRVRLDHKLDCKACGTIQMDIPEGATEHTEIHCSNCGALLGEWGALQDDFASQIRNADVIDLNHGTITKQT
jgi:hypothetical protein